LLVLFLTNANAIAAVAIVRNSKVVVANSGTAPEAPVTVPDMLPDVADGFN
jgi:hypothetical protein